MEYFHYDNEAITSPRSIIKDNEFVVTVAEESLNYFTLKEQFDLQILSSNEVVNVHNESLTQIKK